MPIAIRTQVSPHDVEALEDFLLSLDGQFQPPLSMSIDIKAFARKVVAQAELLIAEDEGQMRGLLAFYCNDFTSRAAHITFLGVDPDFRRKAIARQLLEQCVLTARRKGMKTLQVRTWKTNRPAAQLYRRFGFHKKRECADRADGSISTWFELKIRN